MEEVIGAKLKGIFCFVVVREVFEGISHLVQILAQLYVCGVVLLIVNFILKPISV